MKPIVTVGVCVKDSASTLREAIETIMIQDFPHEQLEIIIVDGTSSDGTLSISEEALSESDLRYEIFQESTGLGFARNLVVQNANGTYIVWVDGDMILPKDYIRKQVEFMERTPKVGIAAGAHGILHDANLIAALEDVAFIATDSKFKNSDFSRFPGTGGAIFRVEAVRSVGGFDSSIRGTGEDIEVAHRIKKSGWQIYRGTESVFYEKRKESWKELWDHYFWYGYGSCSVLYQNDLGMKTLSVMFYMTPFVGFLMGVWYSTISYKILRRKFVFLLPIHYAFKRLAWLFGFARGQIKRVKDHTNSLQ